MLAKRTALAPPLASWLKLASDGSHHKPNHRGVMNHCQGKDDWVYHTDFS